MGEILRARALRLEFQPVVDLDTEEVQGYEALMRGPEEGPLGSPEALIAAATAEGVLEDLDRLARFTALFTVAREKMEVGGHLFLNSEACADPERFRIELAIVEDMAPGIQNVLEITERAASRSHETLASVAETARASGWLVALDNLGRGHSTPDLLSVLRPEFVRLDRSIVHDVPAAGMPDGVHEYVAECGATVIAQGIENMVHLRAARDLGADWGEGWMLGRPRPRPQPKAR